jgi:hypothetical protein
MSTHYFSCLGGTSTDSTKSVLSQVRTNLCFCIRWDLLVTQCIPVRLGRETSMHNLHPVGSAVGSAGHVVHSGVSRARIIEALFFILGWDQYKIHKKRVGTH